MRLFNIVKKTDRQTEAAEKQPAIKSALLQTYFTSLLSLVLCAAMFLGTSYAWFTSEVTNEGNEIYIGILDVGLFRQGDTERLDLADNANKLFDGNIRWEPGYTSLETIHVVNEGDLAFKYVLSFTDGKLDGKADPALQDVAKWFDVWVYSDEENKVPESTGFDQITAPDSGWVNAGTLDRLLAGEAVLSGMMQAKEVRHDPKQAQPNQETVPVNAGTSDGKASEKTYTIALHMQQGADLAVMGRNITLNVKLVAYQMASEQDKFGNRYDQMVASAAELAQALKNGGTVALAADIALTEGVTVPKDVTAHLDLNGHCIQFKTAEAATAITNNGSLTIGNSAGTTGKIALVYEGTATEEKAVNTIRNTGTLIINGGELSNTCVKRINQIGYAIDNYNGASLTVNGGKITATGSGYYDGIRLFCGSNETLVTVNGGEISSVWAQNPSAGKATEVKGTVIVNGGEIGTVYYENYTTVQVKDGVEVTVTPYGAGKDNTESKHDKKTGYTVYTFKIESTTGA